MEETRRKLDAFLASVERRALRMAEFATGSTEEAFDIMQDAMLALVKTYAHKPEDTWKPLFYRILQNRIKDWHRRHRVRNRWRAWFSAGNDGEIDYAADPLENVADADTKGPAEASHLRDTSRLLRSAIRRLPIRQQQAFLLRAWEGLSVADTAAAMNCSDGSVKTHYHRAVRTLRDELEGQWP